MEKMRPKRQARFCRVLWNKARRLDCILRARAVVWSVHYKDGSGCCAGNELQKNKGGSRDTSEEPWVVFPARDGGSWDKEAIVEMS